MKQTGVPVEYVLCTNEGHGFVKKDNVTGFGFPFVTFLPSHAVGIVSLIVFLRVPALIVAAPTQKEPPFLVTQLVVLALFVWLGRAAVRGFSAESAAMVG